MLNPTEWRWMFLFRTVFVVVFMATSVVLVAWEVNSLMSMGSGKSASASLTYMESGSSDVVLGAASDAGAELVDGMNGTVISDDARLGLIRQYLEKYKSPLLPYADLIYQVSSDYGFDYRWIVAIGQQESNLCKKMPENSFNCWGYGIHSKGTLKFDSYELAIKSYAEYLKREYFDKGLNTPELVMKKYCPSSNGSWAYGVNHFFEEIEKGDS